jgi:TRAP-type C4-dicarboxylate transport system substrate-binding protein
LRPGGDPGTLHAFKNDGLIERVYRFLGRRTVRKLILTGAALGVAALAGTQVSAAEVKLKAASFLPARATVAKPFHRWVGEVNKRCAGKVKISVVGPAAIGSLQQWSALKSGVVDMHYGPANYYKGTMPEGAVMDLASTTQPEQRKNGAWAMLNELYMKKMNAYYLTHLTAGVHFYVFTSKPAKNGRFDGMRLRSVPIYDAFFRGLGAKPVRMAPPAVYTALERGAVDGYGWPNWGVADFGWQKYTKYQYGPGFFSAAVKILVNLDKWKGMAPDQRKCLQDMAYWVESVWPKWRAAINKQQNAILRKAGVKYVDMGKGFKEKAEAAYWGDLEKLSPDFVKKIRPLLTQ